MSYAFTKLSDVPVVAEFPEGANAVIETNGEIKRCPSSNVPKPLTYDYMPEGYPKKTMGIVTVMGEQALTFTDAGGTYVANLQDGFKVTAGQTYVVNWDGTKYECVGSTIAETYSIGNVSIAGESSNTGEPFVYVIAAGEGAIGQFYTLDASASHTISVKTTAETVTPMAAEFLPTMNVSVFTNDAGYLTLATLPKYEGVVE